MYNITIPITVIATGAVAIILYSLTHYCMEVKNTYFPKWVIITSMIILVIYSIIASAGVETFFKTKQNNNIQNNNDNYYEAKVKDYYPIKNSYDEPYAWYQTDKGLFLFRYAEPTKNTKVIVLKVYNNNTPNDTSDDTVLELNFYEYYYEVK